MQLTSSQLDLSGQGRVEGVILVAGHRRRNPRLCSVAAVWGWRQAQQGDPAWLFLWKLCSGAVCRGTGSPLVKLGPHPPSTPAPCQVSPPQNLGGEKLNLPMNFGLQIRAGRVRSVPLLLPRVRAPRLGCVPAAGWVLPACSPHILEFPFQEASCCCHLETRNGSGPLGAE